MQVKNRVATLTGSVKDILELKEVIKDAFQGGARMVDNRLIIKQGLYFFLNINIMKINDKTNLL